MIELSPNTAIMVYLGITLMVIMTIWIFQSYRSSNKIILPPEKKMHVCEFCHFPYLGIPEKNITRCPQCNSYNAKQT